MKENQGQILLYQTPDGESCIEVKLQGETVWLSLEQMAELFQRNKSTISRHIKNVFEEGELNADSTVAFFATVQTEGKRKVERDIAFYNLDMIISVGSRVHSYRGVQFRMWATKVLKEYIVKGFALNDDLLKRAGGGNYFDELLARIRDIRSSEEVFCRKVLEIYALSIDYDPRVEMTQEFFKTVQNKMHFAVHGQTAAEIIFDRANAQNDFMGLTTWTGALPKKTDAEIAKKELQSKRGEGNSTFSSHTFKNASCSEVWNQCSPPGIMVTWHWCYLMKSRLTSSLTTISTSGRRINVGVSQ